MKIWLFLLVDKIRICRRFRRFGTGPSGDGGDGDGGDDKGGRQKEAKYGDCMVSMKSS